MLYWFNFLKFFFREKEIYPFPMAYTRSKEGRGRKNRTCVTVDFFPNILRSNSQPNKNDKEIKEQSQKIKEQTSKKYFASASAFARCDQV